MHGRNKNCAWRYCASQCCIFVSLFSGSNRFASNGSRFTAVIELDTLIPRIRFSLKQADTALLICLASHKESLDERHYRRSLILVNEWRIYPLHRSSKFCAVEASKKLWCAMYWYTCNRCTALCCVGVLITKWTDRCFAAGPILPRAYRRHNESGVIGSLQFVWM